MRQMIDPFEPTPIEFHERFEQKLYALEHEAPPARQWIRKVVVLAVCIVLLGSTALALEQIGVFEFLTKRIYGGADITQENVVMPLSQACDSKLLQTELRDAYWDGEKLSVSLYVYPAEGYALYIETDVGADGENFDHIWWNGEIIPLNEWLAGRQALMLYLPEMRINGMTARASWDWVQDEQGETLLLQVKAAGLEHGTELMILLNSKILDTGMVEYATLTATLPAMEHKEDTP